MENNKTSHINGVIAILFISFLAGGTLVGVIFVKPYNQKREQYDIEKYAKAFNESYKGSVINIQFPKGQPKPALIQSLVRIELDYSTTKHYDLRNTNSYFDCVIDYPNAEIIIGRMLNIGDSIIYDGIKDVYWVKVKNYEWYNFKPNITNLNNSYVKEFITIPKYTKTQLDERKKTFPKPLELPNDYYMLLFGKFSKREKLAEAYKKLSSKSKYKGWTIPKYFERRFGNFYFFLSDKRYGSYQEVYKAWKEAGYSELHIVKFDKHNKFIKVLEKKRKKKK